MVTRIKHVLGEDWPGTGAIIGLLILLGGLLGLVFFLLVALYGWLKSGSGTQTETLKRR